MSDNNIFIKSLRESAGMRIAVLFGSFFIFLLLSSLILAGINTIPYGSERTHILLGSCVQSILAFCLPAFLVARFSSNSPFDFLALRKIPTVRSLIGVVIVFIISMPAMEWLIAWNSSLHLPESMSSLEATLRNWEEANGNISKTILDTHGILPILAGVLVVGVLTGFSEELFFRGGVQGIFMRTHIGKNVSIWLAAIIFSAMHFQFFGFLPRLLMGAFFGYLLIWTGSLWVPIFAHVLNNSTVVILSSLYDVKDSIFIGNINAEDVVNNNILAIASALMTLLFIALYRFNPNKRYGKEISYREL